MIDPKVQQYGDVALLTYNLTNYGRLSGAARRPCLPAGIRAKCTPELEKRGSLSIATGRTRNRTLSCRPGNLPEILKPDDELAH